MAQDTKAGNSIKAVERAFEIVEVLRENGGTTLTELSTGLGIPTSTAHVYLQTLEQEGFVIRNERRYYNGLQFLKYGGYARQQHEIYGASRQILRDLAAETGERAGLGVEENGKRVLLNHVDGTDAVSDNIPIGEFTEMHWTSLGKCVLAYLPRTRRKELIIERDLAKATANTITETDALRNELEEIRDHGYSIEDEERREGIRSVAVPILSPDEDILGAIGLTGPTNRFDAEQLLDYVSLLENKANVIYLKTTYY